MLSTMGLAAYARSSNLAAAETRAKAESVASVEIRFEDASDGAVLVFDATSSEQIASIPPTSNGFIRGVMRGMFRTRKLEGIGPEKPFLLQQLQSGSLVLKDPHSGRTVELRSFGETNYQAFAQLLRAGKEA